MKLIRTTDCPSYGRRCTSAIGRARPFTLTLLRSAGLTTLRRVRDIPRSLTLAEAAAADGADIDTLLRELRVFFGTPAATSGKVTRPSSGGQPRRSNAPTDLRAVASEDNRSVEKQQNYVPAIKSDRWLWLYDVVVRWALRESTFKPRLIAQARIEPGQRILDLGCGTGTLLILIKQAHPETEVVGLDGDPKILELAHAKAARAGLTIRLDHGMCFELPYPDVSFDHVFSTLLFHHLTHESRLQTLVEVFRVLRPGGKFHLADWGKPQNGLMRAASRIVEWADGHEATADNLEGKLPEVIRQAGFESVEQTAQFMTLVSTLALHKARKPSA